MQSRAKIDLLNAIYANHADAVEQLMEGVDPAENIENNKTPLQIACDLKHWGCVRAILQKKTNTKDKPAYIESLNYVLNKSIVNSSQENNLIDIARACLEKGAAVNQLHLSRAAHNHNDLMITLLLFYGANPNKRFGEQAPAEYLNKTHERYWDCVKAFVQNYQTKDVNDKAGFSSFLHQAVKEKKHALVQMMLDAGMVQKGCLHEAIQNDDVVMLQMLLSSDGNIAEKVGNKTPMSLAWELKHFECIKILAAVRRADEDTPGFASALLLSIQDNREDLVMSLVKAGAPKHYYEVVSGDTFLQKATRQAGNDKNTNMIGLLLSLGFDSELKSSYYYPAGTTRVPENTREFATRLNLQDIYNEGWSKYYDADIFAKAFDNFYHSLMLFPNTLINLIASYLTLPLDTLTVETFQQGVVMRDSVKQLLNSTSSLISRLNRSPAATTFLAELKGIADSSPTPHKDVTDAVNRFMGTHPAAASNTVILLKRFGLMPSSSQEEKQTSTSCQKNGVTVHVKKQG